MLGAGGSLRRHRPESPSFCFRRPRYQLERKGVYEGGADHEACGHPQSTQQPGSGR
jgi:hypothetical protein